MLNYRNINELQDKEKEFYNLLSGDSSFKMIMGFFKENKDFKIDYFYLSESKWSDSIIPTIYNPLNFLLSKKVNNSEMFEEYLKEISKRISPELLLGLSGLYKKNLIDKESLFFQMITINNKKYVYEGNIYERLRDVSFINLSYEKDAIDDYIEKIDILFKDKEEFKFFALEKKDLYSDLFLNFDKKDKNRTVLEKLTTAMTNSKEEKEFLMLSIYAMTFSYTTLKKTELSKLRKHIEKKPYFDYKNIPATSTNPSVKTFIEEILKKEDYETFNNIKSKIEPEFLSVKLINCFSEFLNQVYLNRKEMKSLSTIKDILTNHLLENHDISEFQNKYGKNIIDYSIGNNPNFKLFNSEFVKKEIYDFYNIIHIELEKKCLNNFIVEKDPSNSFPIKQKRM